MIGGKISGGIMQPPRAASPSPTKMPSELACSALLLMAPTSIATPALTTVWNGQADVGRSAARALLDKLSGSHEPDGIHLIKPEMRIRQSTGPLRVIA